MENKNKKSTDNLTNYLLEECYAMVKHLSADGKDIPKSAVSILEDDLDNDHSQINEQEIISLHKSLSKKISPARPKTVWLLYKESQVKNWYSFLGPVGLIRRLMILSLISLTLFIFLSLSSEINFDNIKNGIYEQNGVVLFIVLSFYLTSASLGASFSNLFQANKYIINNTFDTKYESSYWIRYVLGIIAGILLAVIIPMPETSSSSSDTQLLIISRPVLAMLGGFSASLVYRILFRMVTAVESLFIGKSKENDRKLLSEIQTRKDIELENEQLRILNKLLTLQNSILINNNKVDIQKEIANTISALNN